jgi:hypothetical protein
VHFEVYRGIGAATRGSNRIGTSQIARPKTTNDLVYAGSGATESASNASRVSRALDNIFGDGAQLALAMMTGDVANGFTASLHDDSHPARKQRQPHDETGHIA